MNNGTATRGDFNSPRDILQSTAAALARARRPLLARDVQHAVAATSLAARTPALGAVRAVLSESPLFTSPERYRWQLGRELLPAS